MERFLAHLVVPFGEPAGDALPGEAIMEMEQVPGFRSVNPYPRSFEPEAAPRAAPSVAGVEPEDDDDSEVPPLHFPLDNGVERRRGEDAAAESRPDVARQRELLQHLAPLDFSIHVSMRYHARRRAWYDRFHRLTMLIIAIAGSAGVASIYGGLLVEAEYLAIAVAVAGALELAFSLPERARVEDALYRRFTLLAAEIADAPAIGDFDLRAWEAKRLLIRADADDRLEVLRRICHNLEAEARGYPLERRYRLWPWQRLMAQLFSLPPLRSLRQP
jgi:hypothetical protein